MADEQTVDSSNTTANQPDPAAPKAKRPGGATGKGFVKGDPRINRKGRPKSFDQLRALAQSLANEQARGPSGEPVIVNGVIVYKAGEPIIVEGHIATQTEVILRGLMRNNPEKFLEISHGKVPDQVNVNQKSEVTFRVVRDDRVQHTPADAAPQAG
jgi:hypothetical protein